MTESSRPLSTDLISRNVMKDFYSSFRSMTDVADMLSTAAEDTENMSLNQRKRMELLTDGLKDMTLKEQQLFTQKSSLVVNGNSQVLVSEFTDLFAYVRGKLLRIFMDAGADLASHYPAYLRSTRFEISKFGLLAIKHSFYIQDFWNRYMRLLNVVTQINVRLTAYQLIISASDIIRIDMRLMHVIERADVSGSESSLKIPVPRGTLQFMQETRV